MPSLQEDEPAACAVGGGLHIRRRDKSSADGRPLPKRSQRFHSLGNRLSFQMIQLV